MLGLPMIFPVGSAIAMLCGTELSFRIARSTSPAGTSSIRDWRHASRPQGSASTSAANEGFAICRTGPCDPAPRDLNSTTRRWHRSKTSSHSRQLGCRRRSRLQEVPRKRRRSCVAFRSREFLCTGSEDQHLRGAGRHRSSRLRKACDLRRTFGPIFLLKGTDGEACRAPASRFVGKAE